MSNYLYKPADSLRKQTYTHINFFNSFQRMHESHETHPCIPKNLLRVDSSQNPKGSAKSCHMKKSGITRKGFECYATEFSALSH